MESQVPQRSRQLFDAGYYCAESVLLAVAEARGIRAEIIPRIATGLCSGMARTGGMCGAVSGGILAIGLAAGRDSPDEPVDPSYVLVQRLLRSFEERFGSTSCLELLGCHLGTPEGQRAFAERRLREKCLGFVGGAAEIVVGLLDGSS